MSSIERPPNGERIEADPCPRRCLWPKINGEVGVDMAIESAPEGKADSVLGAWINPIDSAIDVITASFRSNSSFKLSAVVPRLVVFLRAMLFDDVPRTTAGVLACQVSFRLKPGVRD